jgi:hypothetical protein
MVGGSLRVFWLLPSLKLVANDIAEILLKVALKHQKSESNLICRTFLWTFRFLLRIGVIVRLVDIC